jgi:hypothetical protein
MPRAVWLAVAVGIAARLAFALGYWVDKPLTHDEREYLLLARNVAEGRGFVVELPGLPDGPSVERFSRPPARLAAAAGGVLLPRVPGVLSPGAVPDPGGGPDASRDGGGLVGAAGVTV